ncbi:MAG: hypothetical protein AAF415_05360 [Pseudomonadota bacterium]
MSEDESRPYATLALSTKVEEDFVSPLTAVRGALEILRDFPDLEERERQRFIETALRECTRLEQGVGALAASVYAAAREKDAAPVTGPQAYAERIHYLPDLDVIELDFSDLAFSSSQTVNDVYDAIEGVIRQAGRQCYFIVNYRDCSVWPEAWVAYAHRGKRIAVNYALGTVRYAEGAEPPPSPDILPSREAALAEVDAMKAG